MTAMPHTLSRDGDLRAAGRHANKPPVQQGLLHTGKMESGKGRRSPQKFAAAGAPSNSTLQTVQTPDLININSPKRLFTSAFTFLYVSNEKFQGKEIQSEDIKQSSEQDSDMTQKLLL